VYSTGRVQVGATKSVLLLCEVELRAFPSSCTNCSVCVMLRSSTGRWLVHGKRQNVTNLQALSISPSPAQTLPSEAVLDALKMMLIGASLNEVLTSITRLIEAHSEGMCARFSC